MAALMVALRSWRLALPLATQVLQELGWWSNPMSDCIYCRDTTEAVPGVVDGLASAKCMESVWPDPSLPSPAG